VTDRFVLYPASDDMDDEGGAKLELARMLASECGCVVGPRTLVLRAVAAAELAAKDEAGLSQVPFLVTKEDSRWWDVSTKLKAILRGAL